MSATITALVLTFNEEQHIERCIKSLKNFAHRIVIVDSFSTDRTIEICKRLGADIYQNKWINYSEQFQWGLDNCNITTDWTMRVDADEYFEDALISEIKIKTPAISNKINGIYLKRKVLFKGQWIRFGGFYPHILLRIWRTGDGRIEQRWMDEHIVMDNPNTITLDGNLVDDNLNNFGWWIEKHNNYATREMVDALNIKYDFLPKDHGLLDFDDPQAKRKRLIKENIYAKLPLGVGPFCYFLYRYFGLLGFLDGRLGFIFHFMQAFWYRLLVDIKINEVESLLLKKQATSDSEIKTIIKKLYGVSL